MNDDAFHLTPIDIRAQEFHHSFRGYDPAGVEEFKTQVADEVERLLRENAQLEERGRNLREQLKAFREREKAMSEALVAAQQLREQAERAAELHSEATLREAQGEANRIIDEARETERSVRRDIESAQRQLHAYLASFRLLLERHLAEVDAVEASQRNGAAPRHSQSAEIRTPRPSQRAEAVPNGASPATPARPSQTVAPE